MRPNAHLVDVDVTDFVNFLVERENIRKRKAAGLPRDHWTLDPIFQKYKFTNVHREHDHTSKAFLEVYGGPYYQTASLNDVKLMVYNAALARLFGKAETYQYLGWQRTHDPAKLQKKLEARKNAGHRLFTGAYIITSAGSTGPKYKLVIRFLDGVWTHRERIAQAFTVGHTWRGAVDRLKELPGFASFMAKEVLLDVLMKYPNMPIEDRDSWSPLGPGGRRGLNRVIRGAPEAKAANPERELAELWPIVAKAYRKIMNDELTCHDVQFQLCEFDKYSRVSKGEGRRPKSLYTPREGATL